MTVIDHEGRQVAVAPARPDGTFTAEVPVEGQYVLVTSAVGYAPSAVTITTTGESVEATVTLAAHAALNGVVRSTVDGAPVVGAVVTATASGGQVVATAVAGSGGEWQLRGVAEGSYTIVVTAVGFEATATTIAHEASSQRPVVLELTSAVTLTGRVTDGRGGVVAHSQVALLDGAGAMAASVFTDETGHYAFSDLTPGDYTVLASGYAPVAATVDVRAGRFVNHEFVLGAEGR
ncbi:major facilitator superfamily permease [Gordonia neofelifaecis NRRL B-59395]|uniref:Major facilitator superfamily permease n=1 Tax=Gordonia neofelifaecis NRRL B-59395 TaxID=644548 RepID=F1YG45_9ACTN|nr:major facilitator superfamily permease [Gordonia neofelifaecis NRRL B-59395]